MKPNKEAIAGMKDRWGSKHELMTDIAHILKAVATGTHGAGACALCYKVGRGSCAPCPIVVFLGKKCVGFEVFETYRCDSNREPHTVTAILNKLHRLLFKIGELEEW